MKVRINGRSMEADTVQVSREDGEITLFEDGGKLFCKSDSPVAAAQFAPDTVCLDFAPTHGMVALYRGIIESRMNVKPLTVGMPGAEPECCGACRKFHDEDVAGYGVCHEYKAFRHCADRCPRFVPKTKGRRNRP